MPTDESCPSNRGRITSVARTVYIFELTSPDQSTPSGVETVFFTAITSRLVDSTLSDNRGFFQVRLTQGRYSIFVRERGLYYANGRDSEWNINPVTVTAGALTKVQFNIYHAAF